ncbi:DUF6912 family protein [Aestuariimicrobium soli]|uniref:DUF6912 family protein n=1 Tax=Aestuariimicrobium soli TaxID=2035834 RepID=UPI003EBF8E2E
MVFIPFDAAAWPRALDASVPAFSATPALCESFDVTDPEESEFAAMTLASVAGLAQHGTRFVLGAEVADDQVDASADTGNGEVQVSGLRRAQIVSWFTDEFPDDPQVRAAAHEAQGLPLDDAWHLDEVQTLIGHHALLWHAAEELPTNSARED